MSIDERGKRKIPPHQAVVSRKCESVMEIMWKKMGDTYLVLAHRCELSVLWVVRYLVE